MICGIIFSVSIPLGIVSCVYFLTITYTVVIIFVITLSILVVMMFIITLSPIFCIYIKCSKDNKLNYTKNMINIVISVDEINNTSTIYDKYIVQIQPIGCKCPKNRKVRSSIAGCGRKYGCNYDSWGCLLCSKTARFKSWLSQHIIPHHPEILL